MPTNLLPTNSATRSDGRRRFRFLRNGATGLAGILLAGLIAVTGLTGASTGPVAAATKKTTPSKAVFTPTQLAGTYRWVKSTVSLKLKNGKTNSVTVPYGPNDRFTFVVKKGSGSTKLSNGTFKTVTEFGTTSGWWYLRKNGTELELSVDADDTPYLVRTIDQLDSKRLTMSADSAQLLRMFSANNLDGDGDNDVVGGSAFDELVRVK